MTFSDDINRHRTNTRKAMRDTFIASVQEVQKSIVEGSQITTAPGQPVDTGQLKGSWVPEFISDTVWRTTTNVVYAPGIEDQVGPHGAITLRSARGGFHSVRLTRTGWPRIVEIMALRHGGTASGSVTEIR